MPLYTVPNMTIDVTVSETATTIDISMTVTCPYPLQINGVRDPRGPDRLSIYADGQWLDNEHGQFQPDPYKRLYEKSVPKSAHLDPSAISEVTLILQDGVNQGGMFYPVWGPVSFPLTPDASPVPQIVPGKILRALFWTKLGELRSSPATVAAFHAAAVNTLHGGIFSNPADGGGWSTIEAWRAYSIDDPANINNPDGGLRARLQWCADNGFYYIGTGDDICRLPAEKSWVMNTSWAEQAIRETAACLRDSGVCPYVAMRDEQPGLPTDEPVYGQIMSWWRAEGGPPVSWPNQRQPGDPWEALPWSDLNDRYGRTTSAEGWCTDGGPDRSVTMWQAGVQLQNAAMGQPVPGRPLVLLTGAMGDNYTKLVNGGDYQPGLDLLKIASVRDPRIVSDMIKLAMAYGACGVRCYAFDSAEVKQNRFLWPIGSTDLQTGVKIGTPKWDALSEAFNWVKDNEAALCGPYLPPTVSGSTVTGRRDGLSWTVDLLK